MLYTMKHDKALVIFAKEPDPKTVKTRLSPCLSPSERMALYKGLLENTFSIASSIKDASVFISYTPNSGKAFFSKFGFEVFPQEGADLGERMYNSICFIKSSGFQRCIVIGTDIPDISESIIGEGFERLKNCDIVLGPAMDGGYYLIGMKECLKEVFIDISWSTDVVLKQTIEKIAKCEKTFSLLPTLRDIDRPQDIA